MSKFATGLARYFDFAGHQTNLRTEILAGVTTFFTMAYILLVAPSILGKTGMDLGAVFVATGLSACIGTFLMGVVANYPIALAPGIGLISYFAFAVVLGMNVPWTQALGAVFLSGTVFFVLTVTKIRELIINAIPTGLKYAVSSGIGLFIAFIGLKNAQIILPAEATYVMINPDLTKKPEILLTLFGLLITSVMMVRRVKGAIFIGMLATAVVGMMTGLIKVPDKLFAMPPSMAPTFLKLDVMGALELGFVTIVFAFLFVDLFDNAGTLVGVASQAGLMKDNKLPRAGRALITDSIATVLGALFGTSTVTSYIESSAGVASGGRTGMTSVTTALCFAAALFFFPIVQTLASVAAITSPALIIVGVLMAGNLSKIEWDSLSEAIPAFITLIMMPLSFSIATGIAAGFILYPLCKVVAGEGKHVHPVVYVLGVIFILRFMFLGSV
ncbi:guanine permease [Laceyella sacchari]|jgi:AGZA family xanthine/uracil permease-like MFS transporter|uniref:MFS transporter, AGZA family, xanthine/uracil permease n=3 Tax=Laceyella TaxID=292635 RepID=A0AA45WS64_9BACL|nr:MULTISPECIES: NCS2 family permease [Laceyella]AUS07722.1 guanine permease [Laceyella sacchari]PRZ11939.1 AGZA family xanthine/uracil permease-like MFS transporter [Laceyella sediminis]SMP34773.1 putative MFS transporter, AGZA family, xanthine/uracil permease [Laceyella tengchongensis]